MSLVPSSNLQGEYVRALRQAPRKEVSFATVTTGMRVYFSEGSRVVQEVGLFFGGMGPTTVKASKTCQAITGRSDLGVVVFLHYVLDPFPYLSPTCLGFCQAMG